MHYFASDSKDAILWENQKSGLSFCSSSLNPKGYSSVSNESTSMSNESTVSEWIHYMKYKSGVLGFMIHFYGKEFEKKKTPAKLLEQRKEKDKRQLPKACCQETKTELYA